MRRLAVIWLCSVAVAFAGEGGADAQPKRSVAALMQQLTAGARDAQRKAAAELAQIGADAVGPLVKALRHESKRVRFHAAWALKQIGAPAAVPLGKLLAGKEADAKYPAAYALAGVKEPSLLDGWLVAVRDPDPRVRYYAVRALGAYEDPRADKALERALEDKAAFVSQTAAGVAARRGNAGGIDGLAALMQAGVDARARFDAAFALWKLKDKRAVPALIGGLDDSDARVRHHCAWALGNLKAANAAQALVDVLENSTDNTLKSYAVSSLRQITGQEFGFDTAKWRKWLKKKR